MMQRQMEQMGQRRLIERQAGNAMLLATTQQIFVGGRRQRQLTELMFASASHTDTTLRKMSLPSSRIISTCCGKARVIRDVPEEGVRIEQQPPSPSNRSSFRGEDVDLVVAVHDGDLAHALHRHLTAPREPAITAGESFAFPRCRMTLRALLIAGSQRFATSTPGATPSRSTSSARAKSRRGAGARTTTNRRRIAGRTRSSSGGSCGRAGCRRPPGSSRKVAKPQSLKVAKRAPISLFATLRL
jgi:hypothetical protein